MLRIVLGVEDLEKMAITENQKTLMQVKMVIKENQKTLMQVVIKDRNYHLALMTVILEVIIVFSLHLASLYSPIIIFHSSHMIKPGQSIFCHYITHAF